MVSKDNLPLHIGQCPICCDYGMLEIVFNFESKKCSIICEECLLEFDNPENALQKINGIRKSYENAVARIATIEEVIEAGWEKYITNLIGER